MKSKIRISETFERVVDVEAPNEFEAMSIAQEEYYQESIVLDRDDFNGVEFECIGSRENGSDL